MITLNLRYDLGSFIVQLPLVNRKEAEEIGHTFVQKGYLRDNKIYRITEVEIHEIVSADDAMFDFQIDNMNF